MAPRSSGPVFTSRGDNAEVAQYRPLCALAVAALLVGVLSVSAVFSAMFWIVPALGIVLSAVSLRWIAASEPPMVGRGAALAGLGLSVVFAIAAPTDFYYYRWHLRQEARGFGELFFKYLSDQKPELACQLYQPPAVRRPLDDSVWSVYSEGSEERGMLESLLGQRVIHALLLLGNGANVRYYNTDSQFSADERDGVVQSFAVTFDSSGEQQTFFVHLTMQRLQVQGRRGAFWQILRADGD